MKQTLILLLSLIAALTCSSCSESNSKCSESNSISLQLTDGVWMNLKEHVFFKFEKDGTLYYSNERLYGSKIEMAKGSYSNNDSKITILEDEDATILDYSFIDGKLILSNPWSGGIILKKINPDNSDYTFVFNQGSGVGKDCEEVVIDTFEVEDIFE